MRTNQPPNRYQIRRMKSCTASILLTNQRTSFFLFHRPAPPCPLVWCATNTVFRNTGIALHDAGLNTGQEASLATGFLSRASSIFIMKTMKILLAPTGIGEALSNFPLSHDPTRIGLFFFFFVSLYFDMLHLHFTHIIIHCSSLLLSFDFPSIMYTILQFIRSLIP
jgi:hypothetical protein